MKVPESLLSVKKVAPVVGVRIENLKESLKFIVEPIKQYLAISAKRERD